jgi:hypothetical protein
VHGELMIKRPQEVGSVLGSQSANGSYSTWPAK